MNKSRLTSFLPYLVLVMVVALVLSTKSSTDALSKQLIIDAQERYAEQVEATRQIEEHPLEVIELTQSHFAAGSVVIGRDFIVWANEEGQTEKVDMLTKNVLVRLTEDIVFNPNPSSDTLEPFYSGDVLPKQYAYYDPAAFGIGFFGALVVYADDVVIDLNGHTISQGKEHALQQRFFSIIELASQPFIPTEGPHDFGDNIQNARNVTIKNGTLGLSSHYGIHGQLAENILLEDLVIQDFEVGGVSLHGVTDLTISRVTIENSYDQIPVLGLWSAARFLRPYLLALPDGYVLHTTAGDVTKEELVERFVQMNTDLVDGVMNDTTEWKDEYPFLVNKSGLIDGNAYGLVLNPEGVAVNGFPQEFDVLKSSRNCYLTDVTIKNIKNDIKEIPALATTPVSYLGAQVDAVGAALQVIDLIGDDGTFIGTLDTAPIQLAQIMVADAVQNGNSLEPLNTDRLSIKRETLGWVSGLLTFTDANSIFVLNGDVMQHVSKGVIGAKLDGVEGLVVENLTIDGVNNQSEPALSYSDLPFTLETDFTRSYDQGNEIGIKGETLAGKRSNDSRGVSVASSQKVYMEHVTITNVTSNNGPVYDMHIQGDSKQIRVRDLESEHTAEISVPTENTKTITVR